MPGPSESIDVVFLCFLVTIFYAFKRTRHIHSHLSATWLAILQHSCIGFQVVRLKHPLVPSNNFQCHQQQLRAAIVSKLFTEHICLLRRTAASVTNNSDRLPLFCRVHKYPALVASVPTFSCKSITNSIRYRTKTINIRTHLNCKRTTHPHAVRQAEGGCCQAG